MHSPRGQPAQRAPSPLSRQDKDADIASLTQKAEALEAELQDISSQESKDEASLAKVRKQLRDLEAKVKDQEEELDEQAGTIQMLEQVPGTRRAGEGPSCRGLAWERSPSLTRDRGHPEPAAASPSCCRAGFGVRWFHAGCH